MHGHPLPLSFQSGQLADWGGCQPLYLFPISWTRVMPRSTVDGWSDVGQGCDCFGYSTEWVLCLSRTSFTGFCTLGCSHGPVRSSSKYFVDAGKLACCSGNKQDCATSQINKRLGVSTGPSTMPCVAIADGHCPGTTRSRFSLYTTVVLLYRL